MCINCLYQSIICIVISWLPAYYPMNIDVLLPLVDRLNHLVCHVGKLINGGRIKVQNKTSDSQNTEWLDSEANQLDLCQVIKWLWQTNKLSFPKTMHETMHIFLTITINQSTSWPTRQSNRCLLVYKMHKKQNVHIICSFYSYCKQASYGVMQ